MAENSAIEWTTHTFNCWRGCAKISPGCTNCYADTLSKRNPGTLGIWGPKGTRVVAAESAWKEPLKWDRMAREAGERHRVFCASLADVFEDWQGPMMSSKESMALFTDPKEAYGTFVELPSDFKPTGGLGPLTMQDVRNRLFRLIDATPNLDWLLLTKRPENIAKMMPPYFPGGYIAEAGGMNQEGPRPNVWLGTSVENQKAADERIPLLLQTPAAVRFLSCEPLLSEVILHKYFAQCECGHGHGFTACPNYGGVAQTCHKCDCRQLKPKIHWSIIGGESGHGARPCDLAWIRGIVEQCKAAGVACFVKQLGAQPVATVECGILRRYEVVDKKGGDFASFPADLRVRQFPVSSPA